VAKFSARKEVLTPPELHLIEVNGIRIRAYGALHGFHGLIGTAEFVVCSGHLIKNLGTVLVIRVLGEQLFIVSNRFEWALGSCVSSWHVRRCGGTIVACRNLALRSDALLEFLIRFAMTGPRNRRGLIGSTRWSTGRCLGGLWSW